MKFLDDVKFKGKMVLVRVDINSPLINGKVKDNERIKEHSKTIKELSKKGAKVIVISRQGRKGRNDLISLKQHSRLLSKHVGKKVKFGLGEQIESLKNGEILLLENLRFLRNESKFVKALKDFIDYFVMDAFSVAHRKGVYLKFGKAITGRVMEKELKHLKKIHKPKQPYVILLAGKKPEDCILLLKNKKVSKFLVSGVLGDLLLIARGYKLGKKREWLKKRGYLKLLNRVKKFKHNKKIVLPVDVAFVKNGKRRNILVKDLPSKYSYFDIGDKTIRLFQKEIKKAKTIYFKGPVGVYEDNQFAKGTKVLLNEINNSKAFTIMGGGESLDALDKFVKKRKINYISLAGGALLYYLTGKKLPGVEILKK